MEITKKDVLNCLKDEILDRVCDDFYNWIFEDDGNDVCTQFSRRLVDGVLERMSKDFQNNLLTSMKGEIVEAFVERNSEELCQSINYELLRRIVEKIEVSVKCVK